MTVCIVQVLDYEAQKEFKKKRVLECQNCPLKCKKKEEGKMENKPKIIAVDFDGTLCENKWPEIGEANMKLIWYLTEQQQKYGAKIILWTCRAGEKLEEAIKFCEERGLIFDAVNKNLPDIIEMMGGDTRKIYANEYLDDRAINVQYPDSPGGTSNG